MENPGCNSESKGITIMHCDDPLDEANDVQVPVHNSEKLVNWRVSKSEAEVVAQKWRRLRRRGIFVYNKEIRNCNLKRQTQGHGEVK